jgi:hypothetical protein
MVVTDTESNANDLPVGICLASAKFGTFFVTQAFARPVGWAEDNNAVAGDSRPRVQRFLLPRAALRTTCQRNSAAMGVRFAR